MNSFSVIGRLTKKPELKYTKEDKAVVKMDIAIKNGKDDTTFLQISVFGKQAENINKYCDKGSQISVTGMIKNNNYEDKEGNKHYEYSFIAQNIEFLSKSSNDTSKEEKKENKQQKGMTNEEAFAEFGELTQISEEDLAF